VSVVGVVVTGGLKGFFGGTLGVEVVAGTVEGEDVVAAGLSRRSVVEGLEGVLGLEVVSATCTGPPQPTAAKRTSSGNVCRKCMGKTRGRLRNTIRESARQVLCQNILS
jgi:hypothetical protein